MQPSRLERIACYALAVQLYFSTTAFSFTSSPTSRNSNLLGGLAAIRRDDPASPPAFDAASLPPPEKLPDDVPDVSKESLEKAINSKERTLYEILGASPTATRAELKKNYVEMAKLSHPDAQIGKVSISDAPDFGEVAAAWRVLGDSKSRKRYDRELQYKEWAAYASNYANEKMEEAVPAVAKIMDDLALPFLRRTAATTVAVSQAVSNIAKTGANSTSQTGSDADNKNSLTDAFMNAIRAGQKAGRAIDTLELNEKSAQLQERAQKDEQRVREIQEELNAVSQQRLLASLQSEKSSFSSDEARQVLYQVSSNESVPDRPQNVQRIERDIQSLVETEKFFLEKLEAYKESDREWNNFLSKQENAREDLTKRKQEEAEARRRLDEAIRMVSEAKANLVSTSTALRSIEYKVRRNASEMDRVTFTLSKKQQKVRQVLRKKAAMSNGGIQLDFISEEDVAALRRKEMQLAGESEQLARMVARLSSRAEKLRSRAAALDRFQQYEEGALSRNGGEEPREQPPSSSTHQPLSTQDPGTVSS